jgi:hypothetical protein
MVRPIQKVPICLPFQEVSVHADHAVLMEVDNNILSIVGEPQEILDQQPTQQIFLFY